MTNNTVTRETRFFLWLVVLVILSFGGPLYLAPGAAGDYWAWRIADPRTAMMVGAIYFACGFYYILLASRRDWLALQASLKSLFVVAAWLLIAAAFHWDDFFPYRPLTLTWLGAYYLPLLAIPILFRLQRERFGAPEISAEPRIGGVARGWLIARAVVYGPLAIAVFIHASTVAAAWPWHIETLNVRIFSGQIAVFGAFQAIVMREGAWRRLHLFMLLTAFLAALHLAAVAVSTTPYDWSTAAGKALPLMFVEWLVTSLVLLWRFRK